MEGLIVAIGMPVTIVCIVAVVLCVLSMSWAFGTRHQPVHRYTLDQNWDRDPLLLSATEASPVAADHETVGLDELSGGSAHGKW